MNLLDLLRLPPGAVAVFALMMVPIAWAAALVTIDFVRDAVRMRQ